MDVRSFYENRSVLITGATGFIGKALVEKILRSLPMVKKVECSLERAQLSIRGDIDGTGMSQ